MSRRLALLAVAFVSLSTGSISAHDGDGKGNNPAPPGIGGNGPFPSWGIDLLAHRPLNTIGGTTNIIGSDIWGWTDPLTNREYAIFGLTNQTSFIDVTVPTNPVYLGNLPTHTGTSFWREMKTYQNHLYVVSDQNGAHGMQVFDL